MAPGGNAAVAVLSRQLGFSVGDRSCDVFDNGAGSGGEPFADVHPDARFSMFGPSGTKEMLEGKQAFVDFVSRCAAALSDRADEIVAITPIDEECALLHGRAWRKSKATGEEMRYEYAMLYRVENGLITYGADMLDSDAQAFWGRVLGSAAG